VRIGDAARAAGTTTRALRYYEQQGLLSADRTGQGYRSYDEDSIRRVRNIRELLALGFTIDDVRTFAELLDQELPTRFVPADNSGRCDTALNVTRERIASLDERIAHLTDLRDRLNLRLG
jgi:MerR family copper efflux transcriptional regulator